MSLDLKCKKCQGTLLLVVDRTISEPFVVKTKGEKHVLVRLKPNKVFEPTKPAGIKIYCPRCKRRLYSLEHTAKVILNKKDRNVGLLSYDKLVTESDLMPSESSWVNEELSLFFKEHGLQLRERPRSDSSSGT